MLGVGSSWLRTCKGISRRQIFQVAGVEMLGLSLALTGITVAVALFSTMRTVRSFLVTRPE